MFYRSNILKEFQEHISKLDAIELYRLLQDIMNKIEEESVLFPTYNEVISIIHLKNEL